MLYSVSSFIPLKQLSLLSPPFVHSPPLYTIGCYPKIRLLTSHSIEFPFTSPNPSRALGFSIGATIPSNQGTDSVIHFEDFVEKDWSFLDTDETNGDGEHMQKIDRIISAGNIKETSKVLVSIGSKHLCIEWFIHRLVLAALAKRCLPGARVVISHPQGRQVVEEQKQQYPDVVVSSLPEKMTLQNTAVDHSFEVVEFVDEPGFYLAVLRLNAESDNK
ncbi:hypothetical protein DH2020_016776 [Rehmannia glutinosa]|uniref:Uncharacterized protein n=1 Tax=Rehmannia glutinosa TaxID=99300 RepID=A0ABR0WRM2_REHGL